MADMVRIQNQNKELCDRYPFLIPWNRFSGKLITEAKDGGYWPGEPDKVPEYDYEYTELDDLPDGWRVAFGDQMCEEIREALIEDGDLDRYRVVQVKEKYGCYDPETEVLTKAGWKHFADVTMDDEFASLDSDGETLIYQRPTDIIAEHYTGKMYHLENRGVNFFVTENHNMYVAQGSYYNHAKNNEKRLYPFELARPDKYFGKDKRFKKGAAWVGENLYGSFFSVPGYEHTNYMAINNCMRTYKHDGFEVDMIAWLKFLGFYVAEGYTRNRCLNRTDIRIAYNPADEESLVRDLIQGIGFCPKNGGRGIKRIHSAVLGKWLVENCGHLAPNKKVPQFIKDLPPDLIKVFLEYLYIGDGHKNPTSNILTTTSKQLCDDVCELLIKAGYSFSYALRQPKRSSKMVGDRYITGKHIVYEVNWLKLTDIEIDNSKHSKSFIEQYEDYDGMVYCVTIPNHVLYVRRDGKGAWCGNSLRWYDNGIKQGSHVHDIIRKYEDISERTCIVCGKPATRITTGWICPYCDDCCPKGHSESIDEYYGEDK